MCHVCEAAVRQVSGRLFQMLKGRVTDRSDTRTPGGAACHLQQWRAITQQTNKQTNTSDCRDENIRMQPICDSEMDVVLIMWGPDFNGVFPWRNEPECPPAPNRAAHVPRLHLCWPSAWRRRIAAGCSSPCPVCALVTHADNADGWLLWLFWQVKTQNPWEVIGWL